MATVVHDPEYIKWVKRSLNRLTAGYADIRTTDGTPTPRYRELVKIIQEQTGCPMRDGSVDRPTQDRIIAINNVDTNKWSRLYIKWVQEALQLAGFGNGFAADGYMSSTTREAIRKFQRSEKHKSVDGVVGFRTEYDLARKVPGLEIPGHFPGGWKPEPVDPAVKRQDDWLLNRLPKRSIDEELKSFIHHYRMELFDEPLTIIDPEERKVIVCMLKKFESGIYNYRTSRRYDYVQMEKVRSIATGKYPGDPVSTHTRNALADLHSTVGHYGLSIGWAAQFKLFKQHMHAMYISIDNGIREIWLQIGTSSGTLKGSYKDLHDWYEEKQADPKSVISCFPGPSRGLFG